MPLDQSFLWMDPARAHYVKTVLEFLEDEGVNVVDKKCNPLNAPGLCPIEHFWGWLKQDAGCEENWSANSKEQLINKCIKESDVTHCPKLLAHITRNVRMAQDHGPQSVQRLKRF